MSSRPSSSTRALPPLSKPTELNPTRHAAGQEPNPVTQWASRTSDTAAATDERSVVTLSSQVFPEAFRPPPSQSHHKSTENYPDTRREKDLHAHGEVRPKRTPLASLSANKDTVTRVDPPHEAVAPHVPLLDTYQRDKQGEVQQLRNYAAQSDEDRLAVLNNFFADCVGNDDFIKLLEDVEGCWRRVAVETPKVPITR